jgi:hypothetical protein
MESDWIPMDRGSHNETDGNAISKAREHQEMQVGNFKITPAAGLLAIRYKPVS